MTENSILDERCLEKITPNQKARDRAARNMPFSLKENFITAYNVKALTRGSCKEQAVRRRLTSFYQ